MFVYATGIFSVTSHLSGGHTRGHHAAVRLPFEVLAWFKKVLFPGYTGNRQSRASQGIPRFACNPDLNHAPRMTRSFGSSRKTPRIGVAISPGDRLPVAT